jgi:hypothetical protein
MDTLEDVVLPEYAAVPILLCVEKDVDTSNSV